MSTLILICIIVLVMFLEIRFIDPLFWKKGKSDKPGSTIIAAVIIIIIGLLVQLVFHLNWALSAMFLALMLRIGVFDYMYAAIYKKPWNYLGANPTDQLKYKMGLLRYLVELFCIFVGVMQYLYFNCTVYCDGQISILFGLPRYSFF